jgi:hypothetical protein
MEATAPPGPAKQKKRSPSYPGIDLPTALQRAKAIYDAQRNSPAHVDAILQHWGYKPKSGAGLVALAALKKFGLMQDEGSGEARQARLTDLALDILLDSRDDSSERDAKIRQAALNPTIHRELWEDHGGSLPPSDAGLVYELTRKRDFTENAARELLREFRNTISFANLEGGGSLSRHEGDGDDQGDEELKTQVQTDPAGKTPPPPPLTPTSPQPRTIQLPVPGTSWVTVQGAFPLSEEAWEQMIAMLSAMKPGLVKDSDE